MDTTIARNGPGHFTITMASNRGHKTETGQHLTASDILVFPFRFENDPPGVNLCPIDVLSVLHLHLKEVNPAAAEHIEAAVEAMEGTTTEPKKPVGQPVKRLGRKPGKTQTEEAA